MREALVHLLVRVEQARDRLRAHRDPRERGLDLILHRAEWLGIQKALLIREIPGEELGLLLPVEERVHDEVHLLGLQSGVVQRRLQRLARESVLELHAGEALLAGREEHPALVDNRNGGVLVQWGNRQNFHDTSADPCSGRSFHSRLSSSGVLGLAPSSPSIRSNTRRQRSSNSASSCVDRT